jgi:glycerol kinase
MRECVAGAKVAIENIVGVGIAVQRGTFITWNKKTGEPAQPFISWQDTRATDLCDEWNRGTLLKFARGFNRVWNFVAGDEHSKAVSAFHFSPSHASIRYMWALTNLPAVAKLTREKNLSFGTIDTWLVYRLTSGAVHATDVSNATATGLYDPFTLKYGAVARLLSIPLETMPDVRATNADFGSIDAKWLGVALPICAVVGDQQSACFAQRCRSVGDAKVTFGTGMMLDIITGDRALAPFDGFVPLVAWQLTTQRRPTYLVEGACYACGAFIDSAVRLRMIADAKSSAAVALQVDDPW